MRFRSDLLGLGLVAVLASSSSVLAVETSNSEFVIIQADDVLADDLYAGAVKVDIQGTLEGDLVAFAADEVVVAGEVTGSVIAVAPRVRIEGDVGGSVRMAGNDLVVNGNVAGDVVAAAVRTRLGEGSRVGGDVVTWSLSLVSLGQIDEDLSGSQRRAVLGGRIGGDVDVSVGRLEVRAPLSVTGDLGYRSREDALDIERAEVGGAIVQKTPLAPNLRVRALAAVGRGLMVIFLTIAALAAAYGWPERTNRAISEVGLHPIRSWIAGAAVMASPLLLVVLAWVMLSVSPPAASFPLLLVLVPLLLALVGIVLALAVVSGAPAVGKLGAMLFKKLGMAGAILAGAVVAGVLWFLPVIGWLVPVLFLPSGLGGWIRSGAHRAVPGQAGVGTT